MPVSSVSIGCCKDFTLAGMCTVDSKDIKEDKTREEADMTLSTFFFFQKCPKRSKTDPKGG